MRSRSIINTKRATRIKPCRSIRPSIRRASRVTRISARRSRRAGLGNITWTFSQNANITARVFLLGDVRDESSSINGIDLTTPTSPTYGDFVGPGELSFLQNIRAYQVRSETPLGAGELTANVYESDNNVTTDGNQSSPVRRYAPRSSLLRWTKLATLVCELAVCCWRLHRLRRPRISGVRQRRFRRWGRRSTCSTRAAASSRPSDCVSTRASLNRTTRCSARISMDGSAQFMSYNRNVTALFDRHGLPRTAALRTLSVPTLGLAAGCARRLHRSGQSDEQPEHATEYELGISHQLSRRRWISRSIKRTCAIRSRSIIRSAGGFGACAGQTAADPFPDAFRTTAMSATPSIKASKRASCSALRPNISSLTAMYGLNVAYPKTLTRISPIPLSRSFVDNPQFLGIPQQQGSLELDWAQGSWHAAMQGVFRGE